MAPDEEPAVVLQRHAELHLSQISPPGTHGSVNTDEAEAAHIRRETTPRRIKLFSGLSTHTHTQCRNTIQTGRDTVTTHLHNFDCAADVSDRYQLEQ